MKVKNLCLVMSVVVVTLLAATSIGLALDQQPLIYYSFDEISEDVVNDESGNGRIALLEGGVQWTKDSYRNGALVFDGIDGFVRLPDECSSPSG